MIHASPESFIAAIRASHPAMVDVFTKGSCIHLYAILKMAYPQAEGFLLNEEHVITNIDGAWYDILGKIGHPTGDPVHLDALPKETLKGLWSTEPGDIRQFTVHI